MNNIHDLFNERDMIIESMGYFNPLILEENNVILTEGIVGDIVEKIQALWKMIKGWITKLIDFVSSKFRKEKPTTGNKYEGEHISDDRKESASKFNLTNAFFEAVDKKNIRRLRILMKDSLLTDRSFKQFNEMSKYVKNIEGMYDEHDDKKCPFEEDKSKWDKDYMNKQMAQLLGGNFSKKRIEHVKKVITYFYKNEKKNVNESTNMTTPQIIELPKLKDAKKALNDIKKECEKALKEKDPSKIIPKDPKTIRKYFETGGKVKLSRDKILKDSSYMSYLNSKDCTDQLKSYQKSLDIEYKSLQQEAKNIKDEQKSKELLVKARGINVMTQKFLGTAIKCYVHYADLINKAVK